MLKRKKTPGVSFGSTKYRSALADKEIPPLTLDNKWHRIFDAIRPTPRIEKLSKQLNDLLKQQGQLFNDIKGIRNVKQKLMDTVMDSMAVTSSSDQVDIRMQERSRLIEECADKLEIYKEEYDQMPVRIKEVNYSLMLETMDLCYKKFHENSQEIREIDEWVAQTRAELKKQLAIKEEDIAINNTLYSFMHDIFGRKVMEIFDVEYDQEEQMVNSKKAGV